VNGCLQLEPMSVSVSFRSSAVSDNPKILCEVNCDQKVYSLLAQLKLQNGIYPAHLPEKHVQ